ncbi:hypothetical protein SLA2020_030350 [Shorea laevis]
MLSSVQATSTNKYKESYAPLQSIRSFLHIAAHCLTSYSRSIHGSSYSSIYSISNLVSIVSRCVLSFGNHKIDVEYLLVHFHISDMSYLALSLVTL